MVVKFFGNRKGGSGASVDYLLNEREKQGSARTLLGDPKITKDLIRAIDRKQKVTVGCLSFEEANIPETDKFKIMAEFEKTLLPDMQGRYNILWVEHRDKGRLELNFVIPKIELESGKALNPYYHKADMPRMEAFEQVHNLQNGWTNPQDPDKIRSIDIDKKKIHLAQDYEQLDTLLHNLVANGSIQNRSQLLEVLEASKIDVTRQSKDYISVKLPEAKKAHRLKGGIYGEEFRSVESLSTISESATNTAREYRSRDTQRELTTALKKLDEHTQYKARKLQKQFPRRDSQEPERESVADRELNGFSSIDNRRTGDVVHHKINDVGSAKELTDHRQQQPLYSNRGQSTNSRYQNQKPILSTHQGMSHDSIGTTTLNRIRREREAEQRALQRVEQEREALYQRVGESYRAVRADHSRDKERLPKDYLRITSIAKALGEQIERIAQKAKEAYEAIVQRVQKREQQEERTHTHSFGVRR